MTSFGSNPFLLLISVSLLCYLLQSSLAFQIQRPGSSSSLHCGSSQATCKLPPAEEVAASSSPSTSQLNFMKDKKGDNGEDKKTNRIFKGFKRFVQGVMKFRVTKPDTDNRYHLLLLQPKLADKRHTTTRLQRYFPVSTVPLYYINSLLFLSSLYY